MKLKLWVFRIITMVFGFGVLFVGSAVSATLSTQTRIGGTCSDTGTSSASCQTSVNNFPGVSTFEQALARADYGSLGVFATSQQSTVSGFGVGTGHGIWSSFASFQDELAIGVEEGFFRIPVSVSGDVTVNYTGQFRASGNQTRAGARVYVGQTLVFEDIITLGGPSLTNPSRSTFGSYGTNFIDVAFSDGMLNLSAGMYGYSACRAQQDNGSSCTAETDFFNSANFLAATVLDVNKNILTGVSVASASGFDYLAGVTVTPVPVPAAFPLLAGGLGLMGLLGWRRKRKAAAVA